MLDGLLCETPMPLYKAQCRNNLALSLRVGSSQVLQVTNHPLAVDYNLRVLFRVLSIDNLLKVLSFILMEKKLIFLSDKYYLLSNVIHGLLNLMLPFEWNFTCIPILPRTHDSLIHAIFPFIIGLCLDLDNREIFTNNDVIIIDLDKDSIQVVN